MTKEHLLFDVLVKQLDNMSKHDVIASSAAGHDDNIKDECK
jgi:hypothetical protein